MLPRLYRQMRTPLTTLSAIVSMCLGTAQTAIYYFLILGAFAPQCAYSVTARRDACIINAQ